MHTKPPLQLSADNWIHDLESANLSDPVRELLKKALDAYYNHKKDRPYCPSELFEKLIEEVTFIVFHDEFLYPFKVSNRLEFEIL